MSEKRIGGGVILLTVIITSVFFIMAGTVFNWHSRITSWPECEAIINSSYPINKDSTPSWKASAEAETIAFCGSESVPIILKYPAYPQALNYASADSMNAEVATWNNKFLVHVDYDSSDNLHLAFTSGPDITEWVIWSIIFIVLFFLGCAGGVWFMLD